jgi:hypothetical protein
MMACDRAWPWVRAQLDGNAAENPLEVMSGAANGNYGGAVFLQHAHRIAFEEVTARNWNGDGFSFQVCDDISFERCTSANNAVLGFHPGSGSQRPVFRDCHSFGPFMLRVVSIAIT